MALLVRVIRQPPSDAVVVERIVAAVMEQKLPPGAKLAESPLCEAFDCSRTQIRRILVVLAERGMVTLQMNRGAFVSSPKADEARDVFDARRAVERTIVFSAAARAGRRAFDQLRVSVHAGAAAEARGDRRESIRFSGEFHNRLAQIAANAVLAKFLEQLVARTSLIIGLYGSRNVGSCSESDHATLIDALAERNGSRAAELMDLHLRRIEEALDVGDVVAAHVDLLRVCLRIEERVGSLFLKNAKSGIPGADRMNPRTSGCILEARRSALSSRRGLKHHPTIKPVAMLDLQGQSALGPVSSGPPKRVRPLRI